MTRLSLRLTLALAAPLGVLWACTGDDDVFSQPDAGLSDGSNSADRAVPSTDNSGYPPLACGDAGGAPPRALLVHGVPRASELAVVNFDTKAVDGRLGFDGGYGLTSSLGTEPYLLDEEGDIVTRLDAREPWKPVASWNVRGDDIVDGGEPNANPVAVVPVSCSKAYVLRFNRDKIAIIEQSQSGGGVAKGYIDLTPYKAPGDPNVVEMTSAVYIPSKKRVYVLLGNSDLGRIVKVQGPFGEESKLLCTAALKPSIIGIDVETDKIVSLGGTAPGGAIALEGSNPPIGSTLVYDPAFDRLLVLHAGCNEELGDGGPGTIIRRRVEEVTLGNGTVKTLLSLDNQEFPSTLAYLDGDHAALAFFFNGVLWNPHDNAIGPTITGGIELVAADGRGDFFGTRSTLVDGGPGPVEVIAVPKNDAGSSVIMSGPFSKLGGYVSGLEAWPPRP